MRGWHDPVECHPEGFDRFTDVLDLVEAARDEGKIKLAFDLVGVGSGYV
jgi:hypothetical protein